MKLHYGNIYLVRFSPSVGHEYQGQRPAVVIQGDKKLSASDTATIVPLTSQISKRHTDDILVRASSTNKLRTDSLVKTNQITSFDNVRFIKYIGTLEASYLKSIKQYLKIHFAL